MIKYIKESDHSRFRNVLVSPVSGSALLDHEAIARKNMNALVTILEDSINQHNAIVDMTELYDWITFDIVSDLI
jgi:hypothetical protein